MKNDILKSFAATIIIIFAISGISWAQEGGKFVFGMTPENNVTPLTIRMDDRSGVSAVEVSDLRQKAPGAGRSAVFGSIAPCSSSNFEAMDQIGKIDDIVSGCI